VRHTETLSLIPNSRSRGK